MSIPTTIKHGDELRRQLKDARIDEEYYQNEIKQLQKNIDACTVEFLKHDKLEASEIEELEEQFSTNQELQAALEAATRRKSQAARLVEELKIEKDLALREVMRANAKLRSAKNDNITKDIEAVDASKRCAETMTRVKDFLALYELLKNERNKYVLPSNIVEPNSFFHTESS
jgi:predicted RND superfamily exporter protein